MACLILFLILPYFFAQSAAAASNPVFYLNSSLPSTWYNNNSISTNFNGTDGSRVRAVLSRTKGVGFVCGFYCIDPCTSYFFSVIVVGGGNPGVVWTANRDRPAGENARLQLTGDGLVLRDSNGTSLWSTNTSGISVVGMNMTEVGNLVLFNGTGGIVWQSFDHPTDTLLFGQRLYENKRLTSSSSAANWSSGLYYATLTSANGFVAYTEVGQSQSQMYYQLEPEQSSINQSSLTGHCRLLIREEENTSRDGSNYADLQGGGFLVNWGTSQEIVGSNPLELPVKPFIEYIKLGTDGHLKIYRHYNASGPSEVINMVAQNLGECQHPRRCGKYGLCSREGNCSCPIAVDGNQYFKQTESQQPDGGCSMITPLSCPSSPDQHRLVEVRNASYFNIIDPDSALSGIKDVERCKQACLQNCSCNAAIFRHDNNISDGYCYMPSEILSIRDGQIPNHNFTSATYVKVQIPPEERGGSPPPPPPTHRKNLTVILAGSGAGVLLIFIVIVIFWMKLGKTNTEEVDDYEYIRQVPGMPVMLSYEDLRIATEDFKERLGGGGFGSVFKGTLRDGTEVAAKRLDKMGQGMREFLAEVQTIGSLHHFNLVRLIGFCAEKSCRLLVYEYLSNGSLENWIFYRDQKPCVDWETRKKIILDIARGLAYLHEECRQRIIHLDIKPQNILLDENFNAKISDFGLSKLVDRDESQILTTLRGTPGYIAPECGQSKITVKVDIYSFGIVLLETVSGRRNLDRTRSESSKHLLSMLPKKAEEDRLFDIVENLDEEVQGRREEVVRLIKIGAWCLQNDPTRRPLMSTVVKVLEGVMEVDPNINYKFTHAMAPSAVADDHVSTAPQPSVLSNPR